MSLPVKAFLILKNRREIRRFELETPGEFKCLQKKVFSLFPELNPESIIFSWKDDEGDDIRFASDEELRQAISQSKDLIKVYLTDSSDTSTDKVSGQQHKGVICDGCDGEVVGLRYKCLQCVDYDLCLRCEKKNMHSNHVMARITDPSHARFLGMFPFVPGYPRHGWRGCYKGRSGQRGSWANSFNHFAQTHGKRHGNCCPKTEKASEPQKTQPNDDNGKQEEMYLKSIGETVSAMLDPFGVDVAVHIDHNGKTESLTGEKQPSCPEMEKSSSDCFEERNQGDWCMVDDDVQEAVSKSLEEKRVNDIVERLQNMGFVNDDQWLTSLVREKKADMNAVLDAIRFKVDH